MSNFWVCSDNIDGKENKRINTLCDALKKAGHTAHNGGVGPNTVQSHGLTSNAKGQIGVFIVGGSDAGMYVDFRDGLKRGYYHYKYMWVVFASDTATTDKWITCNGLSNTSLVRAWDDNYSGSSIESVGKTAKSYFDSNKKYIGYACGKKGCDFKEVTDNFIKAIGGDTDSSSSSNSSSGASSCKEAVQKLLTHWDGYVECRIRDGVVHIHKIREPQKNCTLLLQEGVNVFSSSIKVTDVNPDTVNHLIVHWSGGTITFKDEELINRFGDIVKEVDAVKTISNTVDKKESNKNKSNKSNNNTSNSNNNSESESKNNSSKTNTILRPITKYEDALSFGNIEWNKIKRDNGHTIECQVQGSPEWRVGEWVRVIFPSFGENGYMYTSRASHSDDGGDWNVNLALVDYPPGWGAETTDDNSTDDEDSESTDDTSSDTTSES
ncbi:MAG: hypothetical protein IJH63_00390 [Methanobrevibacter sp.]|nr:hypothetical protein [Methanosphaera sp.]MBR0369161.1 hypothetical protein [Methanobrevibacter sp.]